MPRKSNPRGAQGSGTIRKKTVTRKGQQYTYWEGRVTIGHDPGTGKQIQKSFTGKTQKEVREKLQAAAVAVNDGTYQEPSKMTLGEWLDVWTKEYLNHVKPRTLESYKCQIENHIRPALGAIKLEALHTPAIQSFYNRLSKERDGKAALSPKSIKIVHGVLHKALQQAVIVGYIRTNPTESCSLPRVIKKELNPLNEQQITAFLNAIQGHKYELLFIVTLFTGMRQGEILGLTWDCVDFDRGTITVNKQLQLARGEDVPYQLVPTKNSKGRKITPASTVMAALKKQRSRQNEMRLQAGRMWENSGLVFTDELGHHLMHHTVYHNFKAVVSSIGCPDVRFHDLRHSYAVAAIRSGDDIKTVQGNLGHATAAFTLDVYGHITEQMKQESAERMERFIKGVSNL